MVPIYELFEKESRKAYESHGIACTTLSNHNEQFKVRSYNFDSSKFDEVNIRVDSESPKRHELEIYTFKLGILASLANLAPVETPII